MKRSGVRSNQRNRTGCSIVLITLLSAVLLLFAALTMGDVMLCIVGTVRASAIAPECHIASLLLMAVALVIALVALLLRTTRWGG